MSDFRNETAMPVARNCLLVEYLLAWLNSSSTVRFTK